MTERQKAYYVRRMLKRMFPHLGPVGLKSLSVVRAATDKRKP